MPTNQIYNLRKQEHLSCIGLKADVYMLVHSLFRLLYNPFSTHIVCNISHIVSTEHTPHTILK